jgi:DNA-binding sugar fermentation-stimulating protein
LKITGILNNVFRPQQTLKKTTIKLHNTLALPVLLYGSETWTVTASDARRKTAAEMKYMRITAGYTWRDYRTNAQIAKQLKNNANFGQITRIQEKLDTA